MDRQFPRFVYKDASTHELVNDEAEFDIAIAEGWFETVPEALEAKGIKAPAPKAAAAPKKAAGWNK